MITYTWKITNIKTATIQEQSDFVVHVQWTKTGTDENGNTGTFIGATPLQETIDPDGNFVPFNQLTEEMVIGWIQDVVVGSYEQHVNGRIQQQIDEKIKVVTETPLPWAPAEDTSTTPAV